MGAAVHELFDIVWSIAWKHMSARTHAHMHVHAHPSAPFNYSSTDKLCYSPQMQSSKFCTNIDTGGVGLNWWQSRSSEKTTPHSTFSLETMRLDAACRDKGEFVSRPVSFPLRWRWCIAPQIAFSEPCIWTKLFWIHKYAGPNSQIQRKDKFNPAEPTPAFLNTSAGITWSKLAVSYVKISQYDIKLNT